MLVKHKFFLIRIRYICILTLTTLCMHSPKVYGEIIVDLPYYKAALEGELFTLSADWADDDPPDIEIYTTWIEWDDGSPGEPGTPEYFEWEIAGTVAGEHVYSDGYSEAWVTADIYDYYSELGTDTMWVQIFNVAPTVDVGPDLTVNVGQAVNYSGSFVDPGWLDDFTGFWDFGEGSVGATLSYENDYPNATGTANDMYTFFSPGTYEVFLTITDDDGGTGNDSLFVYVVPVPGAVLLGMLGLGVAGIKLYKCV